MNEQEYTAIKEQHGYKFSGLVQAARNGFNNAYNESQAEGFPQTQILSEQSNVRGNAVFDAIEAQYGNIDLKALGIGALLSATAAVEQLNDVIRGLEALSNTSKEEFDGFVESLKARVAEQRAAVVGSGLKI